LVSSGEQSSEGLLLWAVACDVALLLAEEALTISLQLGFLLLRDGEGGIVRRRLGLLLVPTARRAATSLAVYGVDWGLVAAGMLLLNAFVIGPLFGRGNVGDGSGEVLVRDGRVLGISKQAKVKVDRDMLVQDGLSLSLGDASRVGETVDFANELVNVQSFVSRVEFELTQLLASFGSLIVVVIYCGESCNHLDGVLERDLIGAVASFQQLSCLTPG
jgi:hypothetical protein